MALSGGLDDKRAIEFIQKNTAQQSQLAKHEAMEEDRKKRERQLKELETKAFLDLQVAAKYQKKEQEKIFDAKHAQIV